MGGDPNKGEPFYTALIFEGEFFWYNDPGGGVKDDSTAKPPTIPKTMDLLIPNNDPDWKTRIRRKSSYTQAISR